MYEWAKEMNCAVTVCDTKGVILFMNDKACKTFAKHGGLIGKNLFDCHNLQSQEKIREMLATGGSNAYTIERSSKWSGGNINGTSGRDAASHTKIKSSREDYFHLHSHTGMNKFTIGRLTMYD